MTTPSSNQRTLPEELRHWSGEYDIPIELIERAATVIERLTPKEPPPGLLLSMAIRMDHGLGVPGYYDQPMFGGEGLTHNQRLESALITAGQMWEEVVGIGFYRYE